MALYNDYCCSNFGLRYYGDYHFWVLRFFQAPVDDFYDQFSTVRADDKQLTNCTKGVIDFRDLSIFSHTEAFYDIVNLSFSQLEVNTKYAVLCNTPLESAFFYLLQQKASMHSYSLSLFSSMDAALEYLNVAVDSFSLDEQLRGLGKKCAVSHSSIIRSVAI